MAQDRRTAKAQKAITDALRAGAIAGDAARAAGVSRRTYHRWLSRGESDGAEARFARFAKAVRKAESEARIAAVVGHLRHGGGLARRVGLPRKALPAEWAKINRHEVSGADGEAVDLRHQPDLDLSKLSDDELDAFELDSGRRLWP
jgi:hypothetical protein